MTRIALFLAAWVVLGAVVSLLIGSLRQCVEVSRCRSLYGMCPHCGRLFPPAPLVATHDWPTLCRQVCPGSGHIPRNPLSDARPLWNGKSNPHFAG